MQRVPIIKHFSTPMHRKSLISFKKSERKISTTQAKFQSEKLIYSEQNSAERSLDFTDVEKAFKQMSTAEVLRGAVVYQFCSYKTLADNSMKVCLFFFINYLYSDFLNSL